jgi:hypothetical protein
MSNLIYLEEIILARKIVREVPDVVKNLDKCIEMLYPNSHYYDIAKVILEMKDSKLMLEVTLEAYKIVLEQNGVKSE